MEIPPRRAADEAPKTSQPSRKAPAIIAVAAVAVLGAGAGIWALSNRDADTAAASDATSSAATTDCPATQTIIADPTIAPVVEAAAQGYSETLRDECHPIQVETKSSKEVAQEGLGSAAGWVPEDVTWQSKATGGDGTLSSAPQQLLGWSPIVMVAPKELSDALGDKSLTGSTLVDLVTTKTTFADYGESSWGRFKLAVPAAADSITGAAGFASLARQVGGGQDFPISAATATEQQRLMPSVQWRTVAQPAPEDVVSQLSANPDDAPYALGVGPRAGITSEVVALNQGKEIEGLDAWHLDGGRSGVKVGLIAPAGNPTVDGFAQWLAGDQGQQTLLNSGLRVTDRAPAAEQLASLGLPPEGISETTGLSSMNWGLMTQVYAAFSHRSSTLTVLDVSGSMGETLPGTEARKVDLITEAASSSWSLWPPGSITGLMTFNTEEDGTPAFRNVIPMQPNNAPEYMSELPGHMAQFQQIRTGGGTPLYEAIWRGYDEIQRVYKPDFTNTIVVLTDGRNQDSTSTMTAEQLIERVKNADPNKKVNIGLVALGSEADFGELKRIADETGNRAWLVQDPREVATVLPQIEIAFAS